MLVKSVMINCLESQSQYSQEYIANVFWRQQIAKVSAITLIPYFKNYKVYYIAYITIDQWCDNEAAYNFIKRLLVPSNEARIIHCGDNWWPVQINTHNNGEIYFSTYTMIFNSNYFVKNVVCSEPLIIINNIGNGNLVGPDHPLFGARTGRGQFPIAPGFDPSLGFVPRFDSMTPFDGRRPFQGEGDWRIKPRFPSTAPRMPGEPNPDHLKPLDYLNDGR